MSPTPSRKPASAGKRTRAAQAQALTWTFLSNHAHVLVCLAQDPDRRLRDVATLVGLTERGVSKIVGELEAAGVITRSREGRRNHYDIDRRVALRHPLEASRTVGSLLDMVFGKIARATRRGSAKR